MFRVSVRGMVCSALIGFCVSGVHAQEKLTKFGAEALAESATPIRPGVPGKTPFWNQYAHQFIYAPAFDYKPVAGAAKYRFVIKSSADGSTQTFDAAQPWSPLSPVWTKMPIGTFTLKVTGVSADGKELGVAGEGRYYRAAWFNGPYHTPVMPYDESARVALDHLLNEGYVQYWVTHKAPDPKYVLYRYPSKIWGALVVGAVTQARLKAGTPEAAKDTELARIIADKLIEVSYKAGTPLEYIPPTYLGYEDVFKKGANHTIKTNAHLTISAFDAGTAFLDLYDLTHDAKYLQAAERIARTLVKNQLPNGTWYQFTYVDTGKPAYEPLAIPTSIVNYFDRLMRSYHVKGLADSRNKALQWLMENPVKTFDWQGQFEDVYARPPYRNQSREQACDLAIYLLRHKKDNAKNVGLAEELIRYAEDQFVIWEKPAPVVTGKEEDSPGRKPENWITPSAQEQYVFWMPVGRTAAVMMDTYRVAWEETGKPIYRAKAESFANSFTVVQKVHDGKYPTFFTKYPMNFWLNSVVYPAKFMMELERDLKK